VTEKGPNIYTEMNEDKRLVQVGNYRLTGRLLGKGHFGKVVEAIHTVLNERVALKIINTKDIRDKYLRRNLKREARVLAKLSHPGIVCLYETMETETSYYLALEIGEFQPRIPIGLLDKCFIFRRWRRPVPVRQVSKDWKSAGNQSEAPRPPAGLRHQAPA
jgi:Protein kinase domain